MFFFVLAVKKKERLEFWDEEKFFSWNFFATNEANIQIRLFSNTKKN